MTDDKQKILDYLRSGSGDPLTIDIRHADLSGFILLNADLRGISFADCVMNKTRFVNCDLSDCDFSRAEITESDWSNCNMSRASVEGATFRGRFAGAITTDVDWNTVTYVQKSVGLV